MGYTTDFTGKFTLDKTLSLPHLNFLNKFSGTRRMKRDVKKLAERIGVYGVADLTSTKAGLDIGVEGANYVDESGFAGQNMSAMDVVCSNSPPKGQPSLWCQWIPTNDGDGIVWDGGEKFYEYVEWLEYIIEMYLKPWGYTLNGEVEWFGEDPDDRGKILVDNNLVSTKVACVTYEDE